MCEMTTVVLVFTVLCGEKTAGKQLLLVMEENEAVVL